MANMKDKEQRRFLGKSKASKQTDQMFHYNVCLGREANRSVTKSCSDNGPSRKPLYTVPGNLQATPEYLQDQADKLCAFSPQRSVHSAEMAAALLPWIHTTAGFTCCVLR